MGEQLDSLSDMVSFGVAPGMILYQLLRISYAQQEGGLDVSIIYLLPAFLFTAAVAWRLAKFNISNNQKFNFQGVPSPAAGLVVASLPLIILYQYFNIQTIFINKWLLYGLILFLSYLMLSNRSFMGLKFADFSLQKNLMKYILIVLSLIAIVILQWFAVPVIFICYIVLSSFFKPAVQSRKQDVERTMDITV
jgi:CDP-diacylglycerol--serine O-phosphatidyltransferase